MGQVDPFVAEAARIQSTGGQLTPEQQTALNLYFPQGLSAAEMSQVAMGNMPEGVNTSQASEAAIYQQTATAQTALNALPGESPEQTEARLKEEAAKQDQGKSGVGSLIAGLFSGAVGMFALKHATDEIGGKLTAQDDRESRITGHDMLIGGNLLAFNDFSRLNPHVREPGIEAGLAEGASRAASIGAAMGPRQQVARDDAGGMMRSLNG